MQTFVAQKKQTFVRKADLEITHTYYSNPQAARLTKACRRADEKGTHQLVLMEPGAQPPSIFSPSPSSSLSTSMLTFTAQPPAVYFCLFQNKNDIFSSEWLNQHKQWHILGMEMYFFSNKEKGSLKLLLPRLHALTWDCSQKSVLKGFNCIPCSSRCLANQSRGVRKTHSKKGHPALQGN